MINDLSTEEQRVNPVIQNKPNVNTEDTDMAVEETTSVTESLPVYDTESLSVFNGEDTNLPIYIALEGKVYDVTEGKKHYEPGGHYNFLAGTDGTKPLKLFGGDTIKKKYPIVGTFSQ